MARTIFVSHANLDGRATEDDRRADRVLNALAADLVGVLGEGYGDCSVRFDREFDERPGEAWRQGIYEWLWRCDAAVILVSPLVFSEGKPWVGRETFTLLVRRANDPSLPIIPVIFGQQSVQQLKEHERFRDLNVGEITQHLYSGNTGATVSLIAQSLKEQLGRRRELDKWSAGWRVYKWLKRFKPDDLIRARELALDDAPALDWPALCPVSELATWLLQLSKVQMAPAFRALSEVALEFRVSGADHEEIAYLLAAQDIPPEIAQHIAVEAAKPDDEDQPRRYVLSLCESDTRLAELLIFSAQSADKISGRILGFDAAAETVDFNADLESQARREVLQHLFKRSPGYLAKIPSQPDKQRSELRQLLVARFGLHSAFFVHISIPQNCESAMLALAREYRRLTLIMRSPEGSSSSNAVAPEGFYPLQPLDKELRQRLIALCNNLCAV